MLISQGGFRKKKAVLPFFITRIYVLLQTVWCVHVFIYIHGHWLNEGSLYRYVSHIGR